MAWILVIFSTTDGHTKKICQKIQAVIEQNDHEVTLVSIDDEQQYDLLLFDKIVVGASIRYGKHNKKVHEFVSRNRAILENVPSAFFSVSVVARKPNRNKPDTNPYMRKFLKQVPWMPDELAVFAGKIDYKKYRFFDRFMIRLIMYMTHGPTDLDTVAEFTNWHDVEEFARAVCEM